MLDRTNVDDISKFQDALKAAAQGVARAQYRLGVMYDSGKGVLQDYKQAVMWYKKAAVQGHAQAQYNLGIMYANGEGVPLDYKQAARWNKIAAEQGHFQAQCNLAKAEEQAHIQTQCNLAKAEEEGHADTHPVTWYKKIAAWFRNPVKQYDGDATEQCDADAEDEDEAEAEIQYNLAEMHSNGKSVPQDCKQATAWYRRTAEQGDAKAQYNLADMYFDGKGVLQDYKQAVTWYRRAADQGNVKAQYALGDMYINGKGVPQDYKQAATCYKKASEQGDADAQYALGYMYDYGKGVPQDYKQAVMWYKKSMEQGNAKAQDRLVMVHAIVQEMSDIVKEQDMLKMVHAIAQGMSNIQKTKNYAYTVSKEKHRKKEVIATEKPNEIQETDTLEMQECKQFVSAMKSNHVFDINRFNRHLTTTNGWGDYPTIRRINRFDSSMDNVQGISSNAFRVVSNLLGKLQGGKAYLVSQKKF